MSVSNPQIPTARTAPPKDSAMRGGAISDGTRHAKVVGGGAVWLEEREQEIWRRWLRLTSLLPGLLHRELQTDAGLSLPDFDVLVQLTDDPRGRVRVSDLASALSWERSRVSHHVTRMERRGLVRREECDDDGRGAFVVLTDEGSSAIERAAPGHVRTVRDLVFNVLDDAEVEALGTVIDKLLRGIEGGELASG